MDNSMFAVPPLSGGSLAEMMQAAMGDMIREIIREELRNFHGKHVCANCHYEID